jgi:hypothetical protein
VTGQLAAVGRLMFDRAPEVLIFNGLAIAQPAHGDRKA